MKKSEQKGKRDRPKVDRTRYGTYGTVEYETIKDRPHTLVCRTLQTVP